MNTSANVFFCHSKWYWCMQSQHGHAVKFAWELENYNKTCKSKGGIEVGQVHDSVHNSGFLPDTTPRNDVTFKFEICIYNKHDNATYVEGVLCKKEQNN